MSTNIAASACHFRPATLNDLDSLLQIEQTCFSNDRLSRRSFKRWIQAAHGILLIAEHQQTVVAYGLVWCHKGTRLARLYSLAVLPLMRGTGLARQLLTLLEREAAERDCLYLRLEVAENNAGAITLYQSCGYFVFGEYSDYYDDHSDALRMQKTIQVFKEDASQRLTPWYQQTTEFTCGPAALMMAMASHNPDCELNQIVELDIWREATTIYMTSGHGGCHPIGLALAAHRRGFDACVFLNTEQTPFVSGVRSEHKKNIIEAVHQQFLNQAQQHQVDIVYEDVSQQQLEDWLEQGWAVLTLISTYRLDGKKTPHWVTVTGADTRCFYLHDPDVEDPNRLGIDCQYLPILREDFHKMAAFGAERLRTAVAIKPPNNKALDIADKAENSA